MSWQLGSFAVLGLALAGGFAWYERSRPPSQIVALVAALAALAIAGRIAFAAFPNVKPTTDIVLLAGYALGSAPGFAVGALTALISNFAFGQGPWTPWQMAGWGLVGIFGALLARGFGRELGRWPLAAACGLAGLGYGALQNFSLMVTYGGEQSLDRFAALSVAAIPFDVAHVAGNVVFALIAAPALVAMLLRFRSRFEFRWTAPARPAAAVTVAVLPVLVLAGLALLSAGAGAAAGAKGAGPEAARGWLERSHNEDGGFGADRGRRSDPLFTGWAMLGLEAAGRNPLDLRKGGRSPVDYLKRKVRGSSDTADIERTALALAGARVKPSGFYGSDPIARLRRRRRADGSVESQVNLTAYAVLAARATGSDVRGFSGSLKWLRAGQNDDGGWGSVRAQPSDADSTGAVLQALAAASQAKSQGARRAVSFLRRAQLRGGGFGQRKGDAANSQSTALAVMGLSAVGSDPARLRKGGRSPLDYLAGRQVGDGHYRYSLRSDQTPVWVTAQVLIAVNGQKLPVTPAPRSTVADDKRRTDPEPRSPSSPERPGRTEPDRPSGARPRPSPGRSGGPGAAPGPTATIPTTPQSPTIATPTIPGAPPATTTVGATAGGEDDGSEAPRIAGALAVLAGVAALWYGVRRRRAGL